MSRIVTREGLDSTHISYPLELPPTLHIESRQLAGVMKLIMKDVQDSLRSEHRETLLRVLRCIGHREEHNQGLTVCNKLAGVVIEQPVTQSRNAIVFIGNPNRINLDMTDSEGRYLVNSTHIETDETGRPRNLVCVVSDESLMSRVKDILERRKGEMGGPTIEYRKGGLLYIHE